MIAGDRTQRNVKKSSIPERTPSCSPGPGNAKMTRCYCETPFAEFTLERSERLTGKLRDQ